MMDSTGRTVFSDRQLRDLILPLMFEQLLVMLVGIVDTFVVSYAGEAAVSGVSLVNSFNTVFIFLFTALASGGAVIISQYIGQKSNDRAGEAAGQLLMISTAFAVAVSLIIYATAAPLLGLLFGNVKPDVMSACMTYLVISVMSYPALAVYNAGAAVFRSVGRTSVTMYISIAANVINIAGDMIGVFILHAGVAGVAYPSLAARAFSGVAVTVLCFRRSMTVRYDRSGIFEWNRLLIRQVLRIALPNGAENGVHQLVKVALSSMISMFGTYQIAANGVAQSIWSLASLTGLAMGPAYITVIGQCMGAEDIPSAEFYFRKLTKISVWLSVIWNGFIFALTPLMMMAYDISPQTKHLVIILVLINNIFNGIAFPFAGPLGNGLRAAGDIKFTMIISIFLTVAVRLSVSYLLGVTMDLGATGIALGMSVDIVVRGIIFIVRYRSGRWKTFRLI